MRPQQTTSPNVQYIPEIVVKRGIEVLTEVLEYIKEIVTNPSVIFVGAITLIEVSPIKVNPWQRIFAWIRNLFLGEIISQLMELKRDFEETKAQDKRWHILSFARSCRQGEKHTKEEWNHAISELKDYEVYTKRKNISNGVIEENAKYLRELYQERLAKNDFL